jgi:hypothetical protein
MPVPEIPRRQQGPLQFMQWFVLAVTLGPMLCCAGCLGYGFFLARLQRPESAPPHTAPAATSAER